MSKQKIYFNEYNLKMGNAIYLPIVSGMLSAYAKQDAEIRDNYDFMPFNFQYEDADTIAQRHVDPSVAAFSASMWNINLCLRVAQKVKEKYPCCLIVFGGPSVPFIADAFMKDHPFIDISVRGEGEIRFAEILKENIRDRNFTKSDGKDFSKIDSISFVGGDGLLHRTQDESQKTKSLEFPSPYTTGEFDYLLKNYDLTFQAIIETNRGCPYNCSFCFWGMGGLSTKYKFFSMESIQETAEWIGENKIPYVFCADSNFGIHKRDLDISNIFVNIKQKYGFPEKFRVCYAKNSTDTVFEICSLFHRNNLEKGATLSFQTVDEEVGQNVGRKNIKLDSYKSLQKKYNEIGIPVYTELIIGLPGESADSFIAGIEYILRAGIKNQLFCYFCQVYPNTELGDPAYQKKYGIKTVSIPLTEIHCTPKNSVLKEYEDIIVSTNAMTVDDWKRMAKVSWLAQFLFSMKSAFYIMVLLQKQYDVNFTDIFKLLLSEKRGSYPTFQKINALFESTLDAMLSGIGKCKVDERFGNIFWDIEEIVFLNIMHESKSQFYNELKIAITEFLLEKQIPFAPTLIDEVFLFNESLIFNPHDNKELYLSFSWNIPEFFDKVFIDDDVQVYLANQSIRIEASQPFDTFYDYAKHVVLYGRKSGNMLRKYNQI